MHNLSDSLMCFSAFGRISQALLLRDASVQVPSLQEVWLQRQQDQRDRPSCLLDRKSSGRPVVLQKRRVHIFPGKLLSSLPIRWFPPA